MANLTRKLTTAEFISFLSSITEPTTVTIQTRTQAKLGKADKERLGLSEALKVVLAQYKLNFWKCPEVLSALPHVKTKTGRPMSISGADWQKHIENSPLTTHKDTGEIYLRVMPTQEKPAKEYYVSRTVIGRMGGGKIVKDSVRQRKEGEANTPLTNFVFKLQSIQWISINGEKIVLSEQK